MILPKFMLYILCLPYRKNTVDQYRGTELERRVKELTSPDINGVSSTAKMEIARATFDYQAYREVR